MVVRTRYAVIKTGWIVIIAENEMSCGCRLDWETMCEERRDMRHFGLMIWFMVVIACGQNVWAESGVGASVPQTTEQVLSPLAREKIAKLHKTEEDKLLKKACLKGRRVTLTCRDRLHYVHTNELYHDVYRKYLENRGGGYIGVGSDQNLTLIAWARSDFAWLMDYDPVVVWVNLINRALILHAKTRHEFIALWETKNWPKAQGIVSQEYSKHPDLTSIEMTHKQFAARLQFHYLKRVQRWRKTWVPVDYSWLHSDKDYGFIRQMFQANRIRVMKGDLLLEKSLTGVGQISHQTQVPIRVVYLSNAEQFWPYPEQFRKNFRGLFMDKQSIILRTIFTTAYGAPLDRSWIYVVQSGQHFQEQLADKKAEKIWHMMKFRQWVSPGLFAIQVPKLKPDFVPAKAQKAHEEWLQKYRKPQKRKKKTSSIHQ